MAEVLVLAERTADGEVKKVTLELLTAAKRLGSPSVVWTGPGADAAAVRLREYGAEKVYAADSPDLNGYVTAPTAELLARLMAALPQRGLEFLQQLLLFGPEAHGSLHHDSAKQIARRAAAHRTNALLAHAKYTSGLRLAGDLQDHLAVERRHLHGTAEGGRGKADRHLAG